MAVTKVQMPKLSEAMESGKIIKWLKKEGDRIQSGDILAEVETDKADVEMEAFGSGVLRKILVGNGEKVAVGALIGVSATSSNSTPGWAATRCGAAPVARAAGAEPAASTSRRTMRPPGPLPWTSLRSTPDWAAIFRASGEAFTRPPSSPPTVTGGAGALT